MAFDLQTIQADARYFALGNSSDTTYASTDLDRNINRWYWRIVGWILKTNGDWQLKGTVATTNIVADQRDYAFPTGILKLNAVYIKYDPDSHYIKAHQRDPYSIGVEPDQADYGYYPDTPEFDLQENSIKIYIPEKEIVAVTAGIKIHFQKSITELSGSSDEPDFPEIFRRLLSMGAAFDYCQANEMRSKAKYLKQDIFGDPTVRDDEGIKGELMEYFSNRSTAREIRLIPADENYK